jgi:hypothetical protein
METDIVEVNSVGKEHFVQVGSSPLTGNDADVAEEEGGEERDDIASFGRVFQEESTFTSSRPEQLQTLIDEFVQLGLPRSETLVDLDEQGSLHTGHEENERRSFLTINPQERDLGDQSVRFRVSRNEQDNDNFENSLRNIPNSPENSSNTLRELVSRRYLNGRPGHDYQTLLERVRNVRRLVGEVRTL